MKFSLFALMALLLPVGLSAHPHSRVDQQAHLSIGRTEAVVTYYLAPSSKSGGHMFDHLDTDGDALLSRAERSAFAAALANRSRLSVDGSPMRLTVTHVAFPQRQAMASGRGIIRVRTRTRLNLGSGAKHRVALEVTYADFGRSWFIQAYYAPDLDGARTQPVVQRGPGSNAIVIAF